MMRRILFTAAVVLAGCATPSIEDTEIQVSEFVKQVSREIQYFYLLNEQENKINPKPVGLCLSAIQFAVIATQSKTNNGGLSLNLGDVQGDNLLGKPSGSLNNTEIRNYIFDIVPDYSRGKSNNLKAFDNIDTSKYEFSEALLRLKQSLVEASNVYENPVFGPPFEPSSLKAKFQFKVERVDNSAQLVLTVLSSAIFSKGVANFGSTKSFTSDVTATVTFALKPKDGICRNAAPKKSGGPTPLVIPIPDAAFSPFSVPLNTD